MEYEEILKYEPYEMDSASKNTLFSKYLSDLTIHHYEKSNEYAKILDALDFKIHEFLNVAEVPFLPVSLFKEIRLLSLDKSQIFKTMTSSGTTGQSVSRIFLDKKTAYNQQKTLAKIMSHYLGISRMPMIIIDKPSVVNSRENFSARGAGIIGFSIFGSRKIYALNDDMSINIEELKVFIDQYINQKIFIFGFTFMIWQHFYKELLKLDCKFDLSNSIMFHGGGWKKLEFEKVSPRVFKDCLRNVCGIREIHDFYGMVEQTGSIFVECESGHMHSTSYSDIIIRNPNDFSIMPNNSAGIIQVISLLPESYPGHSLLTEDEGIIFGEDDCSCGKKGKYFKVIGRLQNTEIRGCSDTYASEFR